MSALNTKSFDAHLTQNSASNNAGALKGKRFTQKCAKWARYFAQTVFLPSRAPGGFDAFRPSLAGWRIMAGRSL